MRGERFGSTFFLNCQKHRPHDLRMIAFNSKGQLFTTSYMIVGLGKPASRVTMGFLFAKTTFYTFSRSMFSIFIVNDYKTIP